MKKIQWEVYLTNAPTVDRYCRRCKKTSGFKSSELFRVNTQQKNLEIWLIYKCISCDTTWKLTIFSGLNSNTMEHSLIDRYANNDKELAMLHATDTALIKRNGALCNYADIEIIGEDFAWYEVNEPVEIHITSKYPIENKTASIIRSKLNISSNTFDKLCKTGNIISLSGHNLQKCKMTDSKIIQIKP